MNHKAGLTATTHQGYKRIAGYNGYKGDMIENSDNHR